MCVWWALDTGVFVYNVTYYSDYIIHIYRERVNIKTRFWIKNKTDYKQIILIEMLFNVI